jgi:hypothetical protein
MPETRAKVWSDFLQCLVLIAATTTLIAIALTLVRMLFHALNIA